MANEGYHEPAEKLSKATLEWIRRRDPAFDHELNDRLFKTGPITGEH